MHEDRRSVWLTGFEKSGAGLPESRDKEYRALSPPLPTYGAASPRRRGAYSAFERPRTGNSSPRIREEQASHTGHCHYTTVGDSADDFREKRMHSDGIIGQCCFVGDCQPL